jgi:hypothetical protein
VFGREFDSGRRHHLAGGSDPALGRVCGLVDLKSGRRAGGGEDLVSGWLEPLHAAERDHVFHRNPSTVDSVPLLGEVVPRPYVGGLGRRRGLVRRPRIRTVAGELAKLELEHGLELPIGLRRVLKFFSVVTQQLLDLISGRSSRGGHVFLLGLVAGCHVTLFEADVAFITIFIFFIFIFVDGQIKIAGIT